MFTPGLFQFIEDDEEKGEAIEKRGSRVTKMCVCVLVVQKKGKVISG